MKIGLFTRDVPANLGGGFVLRDDIARTATGLTGRHRFELVTLPPPKQMVDMRFRARALRKRNRILGRPPTGITTISSEEQFRQDVISRKFDLLWFNHFNPIYVDIPYIMNVFDLQHRVQPFFPEVSINGQWESRETALGEACKRAALVTVGSKEVKDQLDRFYGVNPDNVHILPFPTPQKAIEIATGALDLPVTGDVRAKYGLGRDFLFYPAQFWAHKNHVNLLHALHILRDQRGRSVSLVLTGSDKGNRAHVEATARMLNLADLVKFCGFVPYEDILAFYREALALAYLSFQGPENLPPLEAMALGCPVILADTQGVKELHGDGPVMVDPRDPAAIANGIEFVLDNRSEVEERVKIGRTFALRNNTTLYMERFQQMLDIFEPYRRCWP